MSSDITETSAIAALRQHLTTAPAHELLQLARTCPDRKVTAAAARVDGTLELLRARLSEAVADAYRHAEGVTVPAQAAPPAPDVAAQESTEKPSSRPATANALSRRRRGADRPAPAAPRPRCATPPGRNRNDGTALGDRGMFSMVAPPTEQEADAVRRLCGQMGRDDAETAMFLDMLGVG
ncbi:hypothetical protein ACIBCT_39015 [Streptosporangium sp. NPDC050855]|uniref:hypothetical protein n=1 Tax=Streptosporangium sp. NPDC050855 TaxID=3366194 RepID=UPI0037B55A98